jgi:hypothetical protein
MSEFQTQDWSCAVPILHLSNLGENLNMKQKLLVISSLFLTILGCQSALDRAARNTTYKAYELVGVQKRELLKNRVDDARDEQKEAGKKFENALDQLKSLYGFKGGKLESKYDSLKSSYDKASDQADDVKKSVRKVETVAQDLFAEWEKEIEQIETASLKLKSRERLAETRTRYNQLHSNLKASEDRMTPVLHKFNDQVLYLKHNLNAQAIASLKGESLNIQADIEKLIQDMNKSIASADEFIKQMPE